MKKTAVFISGRGSNLQCLLDKENSNIRVVVSNKTTAEGLKKAKRFSIATLLVKPFDYDFVDEVLKKGKISKILLLGFMKIIPEKFVENWKLKIINIHPSLLPLFPGKDSLEKSFFSQEDMGITLHHVIAEMDAGPVIAQSKVIFNNNKNVNKDINKDLQYAQIVMSFREHYLMRRLVDKWQ